MSIVNQIAENLMKGKANDVKALVEKALADGVAPASSVTASRRTKSMCPRFSSPPAR
jgi:hypothetical protein